MTTTASTTQDTRTVDTSQLFAGDIVRAYGMRVRIEHVAVYERDSDSKVRSCVGTVLNPAAVKEEGFVPQSFLRCDGSECVRDEVREAHEAHGRDGECWTIQGNTLARWLVEA